VLSGALSIIVHYNLKYAYEGGALAWTTSVTDSGSSMCMSGDCSAEEYVGTVGLRWWGDPEADEVPSLSELLYLNLHSHRQRPHRRILCLQR
jgi:hypothetical protein